MHSFLMQDWTTVRGASNTVSVAMSESDYVDMRPYQDVVFWTEVKYVALAAATNVSINYETAPAKEEALFAAMRAASAYTTTGSPSPSVTVNQALLSAAATTTPVSRWMRWKVTSTSTTAWEITFRIWAVAGLSGR